MIRKRSPAFTLSPCVLSGEPSLSGWFSDVILRLQSHHIRVLAPDRPQKGKHTQISYPPEHTARQPSSLTHRREGRALVLPDCQIAARLGVTLVHPRMAACLRLLLRSGAPPTALRALSPAAAAAPGANRAAPRRAMAAAARAGTYARAARETAANGGRLGRYQREGRRAARSMVAASPEAGEMGAGRASKAPHSARLLLDVRQASTAPAARQGARLLRRATRGARRVRQVVGCELWLGKRVRPHAEVRSGRGEKPTSVPSARNPEACDLFGFVWRMRQCLVLTPMRSTHVCTTADFMPMGRRKPDNEACSALSGREATSPTARMRWSRPWSRLVGSTGFGFWYGCTSELV